MLEVSVAGCDGEPTKYLVSLQTAGTGAVAGQYEVPLAPFIRECNVIKKKFDSQGEKFEVTELDVRTALKLGGADDAVTPFDIAGLDAKAFFTHAVFKRLVSWLSDTDSYQNFNSSSKAIESLDAEKTDIVAKANSSSESDLKALMTRVDGVRRRLVRLEMLASDDGVDDYSVIEARMALNNDVDTLLADAGLPIEGRERPFPVLTTDVMVSGLNNCAGMVTRLREAVSKGFSAKMVNELKASLTKTEERLARARERRELSKAHAEETGFNEENLFTLFALAEAFGVKKLRDQCITFVKSHPDPIFVSKAQLPEIFHIGRPRVVKRKSQEAVFTQSTSARPSPAPASKPSSPSPTPATAVVEPSRDGRLSSVSDRISTVSSAKPSLSPAPRPKSPYRVVSPSRHTTFREENPWEEGGRAMTGSPRPEALDLDRMDIDDYNDNSRLEKNAEVAVGKERGSANVRRRLNESFRNAEEPLDTSHQTQSALELDDVSAVVPPSEAAVGMDTSMMSDVNGAGGAMPSYHQVAPLRSSSSPRNDALDELSRRVRNALEDGQHLNAESMSFSEHYKARSRSPLASGAGGAAPPSTNADSFIVSRLPVKPVQQHRGAADARSSPFRPGGPASPTPLSNITGDSLGFGSVASALGSSRAANASHAKEQGSYLEFLRALTSSRQGRSRRKSQSPPRLAGSSINRKQSPVRPLAQRLRGNPSSPRSMAFSQMVTQNTEEFDVLKARCAVGQDVLAHMESGSFSPTKSRPSGSPGPAPSSSVYNRSPSPYQSYVGAFAVDARAPSPESSRKSPAGNSIDSRNRLFESLKAIACQSPFPVLLQEGRPLSSSPTASAVANEAVNAAASLVDGVASTAAIEREVRSGSPSRSPTQSPPMSRAEQEALVSTFLGKYESSAGPVDVKQFLADARRAVSASPDSLADDNSLQIEELGHNDESAVVASRSDVEVAATDARPSSSSPAQDVLSNMHLVEESKAMSASPLRASPHHQPFHHTRMNGAPASPSRYASVDNDSVVYGGPRVESPARSRSPSERVYSRIEENARSVSPLYKHAQNEAGARASAIFDTRDDRRRGHDVDVTYATSTRLMASPPRGPRSPLPAWGRDSINRTHISTNLTEDEWKARDEILNRLAQDDDDAWSPEKAVIDRAVHAPEDVIPPHLRASGGADPYDTDVARQEAVDAVLKKYITELESRWGPELEIAGATEGTLKANDPLSLSSVLSEKDIRQPTGSHAEASPGGVGSDLPEEVHEEVLGDVAGVDEEAKEVARSIVANSNLMAEVQRQDEERRQRLSRNRSPRAEPTDGIAPAISEDGGSQRSGGRVGTRPSPGTKIPSAQQSPVRSKSAQRIPKPSDVAAKVQAVPIASEKTMSAAEAAEARARAHEEQVIEARKRAAIRVIEKKQHDEKASVERALKEQAEAQKRAKLHDLHRTALDKVRDSAGKAKARSLAASKRRRDEETEARRLREEKEQQVIEARQRAEERAKMKRKEMKDRERQQKEQERRREEEKWRNRDARIKQFMARTGGTGDEPGRTPSILSVGASSAASGRVDSSPASRPSVASTATSHTRRASYTFDGVKRPDAQVDRAPVVEVSLVKAAEASAAQSPKQKVRPGAVPTSILSPRRKGSTPSRPGKSVNLLLEGDAKPVPAREVPKSAEKAAQSPGSRSRGSLPDDDDMALLDSVEGELL